MDAEFWHGLWARGRIAFHEGEANAMLVAWFDRLALAPGARVFVPLCGKTRDIAWLLAQGHRVVGAELSDLAVEQLFAELGAEPRIDDAGPMRRFRAGGVEVFLGDVFDLSAAMLGPVDAVYDRAALVALPAGTRRRYADHLAAITGTAPQLVIAVEHGRTEGPPFSVDPAEMHRLYGDRYTLLELARAAPGVDMRGRDAVWLLRGRDET